MTVTYIAGGLKYCKVFSVSENTDADYLIPFSGCDMATVSSAAQ